MTQIEETSEWLKATSLPYENLTKGLNVFGDLRAGTAQNPTFASPTIDYARNAKEQESPGTFPVSIYEGLQTAVNIARTRSGFNPLNPTGSGDEAHFIAFTDEIARIPFFALNSSFRREVHQRSQNADELINSFLDGFVGLAAGDVVKIRDALKSLVSAALSYASAQQVQSNFTQNILEDGNGRVLFTLYASEFTIEARSGKGTIKFESHYLLRQAQYSLSSASWENVRELFRDREKEDTEDWLNRMRTQNNPNSQIRIPCFE
ncbi:hypothetical protein [Burkholderia stagnalis]|uniref:hypothetical protein n=1 Tax=Burkholderia stagnalis TaxID=1503054 RepID=UPI000A483FBC|nr:hypothetical protein [Burkholderia stagnalis]